MCNSCGIGSSVIGGNGAGDNVTRSCCISFLYAVSRDLSCKRSSSNIEHQAQMQHPRAMRSGTVSCLFRSTRLLAKATTRALSAGNPWEKTWATWSTASRSGPSKQTLAMVAHVGHQRWRVARGRSLQPGQMRDLVVMRSWYKHRQQVLPPDADDHLEQVI